MNTFNETKFNECFDKAAEPWIFIPVLTREEALAMVKEYLDVVKKDEPESISEPHLPTVGGRRLRGSFSEFEQVCLVHIQRLQENIGDYDCAMLDTFCEAVRIVRKYSDVMQEHTTAPLCECPACTNKEPTRPTCSLCGHKYYGEGS